jgi:hypothetical protein
VPPGRRSRRGLDIEWDRDIEFGRKVGTTLCVSAGRAAVRYVI